MRQSTTFKVLSVFLMLFMVVGFAQAQFTTAISGHVTDANSNPVPGYKMMISFKDDTVGFNLPIITNEDGAYIVTVLYNHTYTIKSMDSFIYEPFSADVVVGTDPVEQNFTLVKRTDLHNVTGNVTFEGNGVETTLYFQLLSDSVDINDFRTYESHFAIPGLLLPWASYNAMSDADGNFALEMIDGKYVVYIPATDTTLAHWGVFEVNGDIQVEPIVLQKMSTLSGHVENAGQYENVVIFGYSLNAGRPAMAMVDGNGDYTMDVAPGEYVVRCQAFFDDYMYAVFYDSVYSAEDATPVVVDENGGTADFNLPNAQVSDFSISGTVTSNNSGLPLEGANVMFASYNFFSNLYQTYEATTGPDGTYKVEGKTIMAEDSLVGFAWKDSTFFAQFYDGQATFLNADPIVYHAGENVTGIDFALDSIDTENNFSISGMVKDEDGNPVTTGQVTAYTTATNVGVITALIDPLGNYAFDSVFPSGSTVYLQAWGGFGYLPSIYDGAESWKEADAIEITDHNVDNINFTLEKVGPARVPLGSISGVVNITGGQSLAKASAESNFEGDVVYVKPAGADEWTGYDYVDADGNFTLPVEKDGEYEILLSSRENGDISGTATVTDLQAEIEMNVTGIKDLPVGIIKSATLHEAYPNPFNPSTTIQVDMAKTAQASLTIYNVLGQKVKVLYNGKLDQGSQKFTWNGTSFNGRQVASGLYFYQLKAGNTVQTKAVMFIK